VTTDSLREQVRSLPSQPGVYLFRDEDGEILYVGKARSLRERVRSYFGSAADRSFKQRELSRRVASVETFVVDSDAEALLLESNLVKEHAPRFNIQLRDDKSFPYVKVTVQEAFPRVLVTRRLVRDGSRYFGPFTDVGAMRRALRLIRGLSTVRSCHFSLPRETPERPCLEYFIDRCKAPCVGYQTEADYRAMIDRILEILAGHTGRLKGDVRLEMESAAADLDFERAAELRDVLRGLGSLERRQTSIDFRGGDRDVLGLARSGSIACCLFLRVREGKLLGRDVHFLTIGVGEDDPAAITAAAVKGAYLQHEDLPPELLVPSGFEDLELVESVLRSRRGAGFAIRVPLRGRKRRLLDLAGGNAEHLLSERQSLMSPGEAVEQVPPAARDLAIALSLPSPPRNLVCFDISTLAGSDSVGSAAWLADGAPRKAEYRRFRIRRTPEGKTDDYSMMQEIVGRYFHRRIAEDRPLPDLVIVDGGKGQLAAALHAMEGAGVSDLPAVSLAKREEEVFLPGRGDALHLDRRSPALHWLQRVRDEAHRFAIEYNRKLRRKRTLRSRLSEIPGVGPAREADLLREFGSLEAIRSASPGELSTVPGIGPTTARRIAAELSKGDKSP
jgi:excinuclease ABC subunit C